MLRNNLDYFQLIIPTKQVRFLVFLTGDTYDTLKPFQDMSLEEIESKVTHGGKVLSSMVFHQEKRSKGYTCRMGHSCSNVAKLFAIFDEEMALGERRQIMDLLNDKWHQKFTHVSSCTQAAMGKGYQEMTAKVDFRLMKEFKPKLINNKWIKWNRAALREP